MNSLLMKEMPVSTVYLIRLVPVHLHYNTNAVVEVKEFNTFEVLFHLIAPHTNQALLTRFEVKYIILYGDLLMFYS